MLSPALLSEYTAYSSTLYHNLQAKKISFLIACNIDVDECITGNHDCDVNANCTNTIGGFNCSCKKGFAGDGRSCSGKLT